MRLKINLEIGKEIFLKKGYTKLEQVIGMLVKKISKKLKKLEYFYCITYWIL